MQLQAGAVVGSRPGLDRLTHARFAPLPLQASSRAAVVLPSEL